MNSKFTAAEQAAINKATEERHLNDFKVKTEKYHALNKIAKPDQIVFAGDSITEGFPTAELFDTDKIIYNRGIGAIKSDYLLKHIKTLIIDLKPEKAFILIGTNDLSYAITPEKIFENIKNICLKVEAEISGVKIYLMSIYPVNEEKEYKDAVGLRTNKDILTVNHKLKTFCANSENREYLNFVDILVLEDQLNPEYSYDGLHMTVAGYLKITEKLNYYLK